MSNDNFSFVLAPRRDIRSPEALVTEDVTEAFTMIRDAGYDLPASVQAHAVKAVLVFCAFLLEKKDPLLAGSSGDEDNTDALLREFFCRDIGWSGERYNYFVYLANTVMAVEMAEGDRDIEKSLSQVFAELKEYLRGRNRR